MICYYERGAIHQREIHHRSYTAPYHCRRGGIRSGSHLGARNIGNYDILGYCDDNPELKGHVTYGARVLGTPEKVNIDLADKPFFVCAIGKNAVRKQVVERVLAWGWQPVSLVDPSVIVAANVTVGPGTYVGAGTILSPNAQNRGARHH